MRALWEMTRVELLLFLREPLTVMFVVVLPVVMLYVLNGVFASQPAGPEVWQGMGAVDFYTPAYVGLVAATAGVLSVPVHLASYRENGVLRRYRASAVPGAVVVAAQMVVAAITAAVGAALLTLVAALAYDALLPQDVAGTVAAFLLVTVAFAALGALLGFLMPTARAAQGAGVLLFFVFLMLGGPGPPAEILPDGLRRIGEALPMTQASDLLRAPWTGSGWDAGATAFLVLMLVASVGVTAWLWRRSDAG